jgi:prephenate dehydrogenase
VLGVGLIGGSLAAALKRAGLAEQVAGFSPGADLALALERGLVDEAAGSVADAVANADLVILAAPITALPELMRSMAPHLSIDAIVTDCASTKRSVLAAADQCLGRHARYFVAGHPIAGSEHSGAAAARADLFDGAQVMICPAADTDSAALDRIETMWRDLGGHPQRIDAAAHDRLYGELSHWPHAVAFALSAAVAAGAHADDALKFAGGGLRDTTRIGASSPELWADILLDNRDAVMHSALAFQQQIDELLEALESGRRDELIERLANGSRWRRRLP